MNHYTFTRQDGELDIEAWRPLDRALYRWVRTHGGSETLATTVAWTSLADGQGDTALSLTDAESRSGLSPLSEADIAALRQEPMVATEACVQMLTMCWMQGCAIAATGSSAHLSCNSVWTICSIAFTGAIPAAQVAITTCSQAHHAWRDCRLA